MASHSYAHLGFTPGVITRVFFPLIIINNVLRNAHDGTIVVLHITQANAPHTADAPPTIITGLRAHGYQLVRLSELLAPSPPVSLVLVNRFIGQRRAGPSEAEFASFMVASSIARQPAERRFDAVVHLCSVPIQAPGWLSYSAYAGLVLARCRAELRAAFDD